MKFCPLGKNMEDLEGNMLSQTEKDKLYDVTYMQNLKRTANQCIYNKKEADSQIHKEESRGYQWICLASGLAVPQVPRLSSPRKDRSPIET